MQYFYANIPEKTDFLIPEKRKAFALTRDRILYRMEKLEKALIRSSLRGEDFSCPAEILFKNFPEKFDEMDFASLSEDVLRHYDGSIQEERIEWPNADVVFDSAFVTRKEWEDMRHLGIGGSDVAVLQDISPFRTPQELYYDKKGYQERDIQDPMRQSVFDRGHFIEEKVIQAFCNLMGAKVHKETRMFRSFYYPAATANIDAIVEIEKELYIFEAKTTFTSNYSHWASGQIPAYYLPQTHQYPAVLADPRIKGTYIGCLFTDDLVVGGTYCGSNWDSKSFVSRFVNRDKLLEEELLRSEQEFWEEYIERNRLPGETSKMREMENAQRYTLGYPKEKGAILIEGSERMIDLMKDYRDVQDAYLKSKKMMDRNDEARRDLQAEIISSLKGHEKGLFDLSEDKFLEISYKAPQDRASVDLEMLEVRYPKAYQDCVTFCQQKPRFTFKEKPKFMGWDQKD